MIVTRFFISGVDNPHTWASGMTITVPSGATYVRFGLTHEANVITKNWRLLTFSKGNSAIQFEPYYKTISSFRNDIPFDLYSGTSNVTFDSNGRLSQIVDNKDGKQIVTTLTYESGNLSKVEEESEGFKLTTVFNFENGKLVNTSTTTDVI